MKYKRIEGHEGYLIYKNGDVVSLLRSKPINLTRWQAIQNGIR
jgi:hypothetical protein